MAPSYFRVEPEFLVKIDPALGAVGVLLEPTSIVAKAWDHTERIGRRSRAWQPEDAAGHRSRPDRPARRTDGRPTRPRSARARSIMRAGQAALVRDLGGTSIPDPRRLDISGPIS